MEYDINMTDLRKKWAKEYIELRDNANRGQDTVTVSQERLTQLVFHWLTEFVKDLGMTTISDIERLGGLE